MTKEILLFTKLFYKNKNTDEKKCLHVIIAIYLERRSLWDPGIYTVIKPAFTNISDMTYHNIPECVNNHAYSGHTESIFWGKNTTQDKNEIRAKEK